MLLSRPRKENPVDFASGRQLSQVKFLGQSLRSQAGTSKFDHATEILGDTIDPRWNGLGVFSPYHVNRQSEVGWSERPTRMRKRRMKTCDDVRCPSRRYHRSRALRPLMSVAFALPSITANTWYCRKGCSDQPQGEGAYEQPAGERSCSARRLTLRQVHSMDEISMRLTVSRFVFETAKEDGSILVAYR